MEQSKKKLRTARIRVECLDETKKRWGKALSGTGPRRPNEEVIIFSSWDQLGHALSPARLQILSAVLQTKPKSISALARALRRDFKNVYNDVRLLSDIGLLDLRAKGTRKALVPEARLRELTIGFGRL